MTSCDVEMPKLSDHGCVSSGFLTFVLLFPYMCRLYGVQPNYLIFFSIGRIRPPLHGVRIGYISKAEAIFVLFLRSIRTVDEAFILESQVKLFVDVNLADFYLRKAAFVNVWAEETTLRLRPPPKAGYVVMSSSHS